MKESIEVKDIREGDVIRREYPSGFGGAYRAIEYVAKHDEDGKGVGGDYYLLERPMKLPTEPGYYRDRYGNAWLLTTVGWWIGGKFYSDADADEYAPFTRLEPVPETAKKVLAAVEVAMTKRDWSTAWPDLADVWADVAEQFGVES